MRGRIATVTMLAAGLVAATPTVLANATDDVSQSAIGTYTFGYSADKPVTKWVLSPCENDAPRCVTVSQYGVKDTQMKRPDMTGNAYWTVGSWVMFTDVKNIITCPENQEEFTLPVTFSWDAATNEGYRSFDDPGLCGNEAKMKTSKIVLTKIGAEAPAPLSQAPAPPGPPAPAAAEAPAPAPASAQPSVLPPLGAAESMAPPPAA